MQSAGRRMSKRTASSHTTEAETGTHSFKIVGYTLKKGIGVGKYIQSGTFTVGGYDWAIRYYPDGFSEETKAFVSVYLQLVSNNAEVRAFYDLSFVNAKGLPLSLISEKTPRVFSCTNLSYFSKALLIQRNNLESQSARYIEDNCLRIECTITVIKESHVSETTRDLAAIIEVPPSDLSQQFGKLLLEEEGADVKFRVGSHTFPAHRIVLAARSPVFKAELYGQMKERRARCVTVEDIQPDVFKALLQFIYTDSLPEWDVLEEYCEMVRHLLVAADRYAMDRLKLLCASFLAKNLGAENVATTLALADQHNCDRLKDVCIQFMASSGEMDAVVKTEGYANLKRTCPSILLDVLEKANSYHRT